MGSELDESKKDVVRKPREIWEETRSELKITRARVMAVNEKKLRINLGTGTC